jgi:hypothetical protein
MARGVTHRPKGQCGLPNVADGSNVRRFAFTAFAHCSCHSGNAPLLVVSDLNQETINKILLAAMTVVLRGMVWRGHAEAVIVGKGLQDTLMLVRTPELVDRAHIKMQRRAAGGDGGRRDGPHRHWVTRDRAMAETSPGSCMRPCWRCRGNIRCSRSAIRRRRA